MTLMERRRALLYCKKLKPGLADGQYRASNPPGTITVQNNRITFGAFSANYRNFDVPLTTPINLSAGDVVTFTSANPSTSNNTPMAIGFNGSFLSGEYKPFKPSNKSVTIGQNITATSIHFQGVTAFANLSFTQGIMVNSQIIF